MHDMGARAVHFVGSFPAESTDDAMRAMLNGAATRLRTLATGETNRYEWYIQPIVEDLARQGLLEVKRQGSWRTSSDRTLYQVPRGVELTGEMMNLGIPAEAEEALPVFHRLREAYELPDLSLQIGMPSDFTLSFISMGVNGVRKHKKAFTDALVRDIAAVQKLVENDVLIQIEATAELVLLAKTQPFHRFVEAKLRLGEGIAAMAAAAPAGTRFGVHLCLGSMRNKARTTMRDARPLVALANSVARHWPAGRPLEYIHGPLAAGDKPPSTNPKWYAPLADLAIGENTGFYAGFVHETPAEAEQVRTLRMIEAALGRSVDGVASACGLGRRPRDIADRMVVRAAALAAAD